MDLQTLARCPLPARYPGGGGSRGEEEEEKVVVAKVTSEQMPVCKSVYHQPHQLTLTTLGRTRLLLIEC